MVFSHQRKHRLLLLNAAGSTLKHRRQPGMVDALFARDAGLVNADQQALKRLQESRSPSVTP
ncbi:MULTISPECIES: hypothetical protein [Serratia]|uniref:hypothetical protein n=1 Tax=Serratia TaxID=613 RepID=UPI000C130655|nr:hypothetical protein [Serratia marcescens]MCW7557787.1 hypothetical protein [Serratia marcescens]MCW7562691.1 hypothetical protein [Serratia marcescens]MCW7566707.1 hypothetical protein [Serratia marcescens]MCW7572693.1 hypothetical protein [Serratia marcescens]MCW7576707.1 hypothetical protein [Serratia marcescens]